MAQESQEESMRAGKFPLESEKERKPASAFVGGTLKKGTGWESLWSAVQQILELAGRFL